MSQTIDLPISLVAFNRAAEVADLLRSIETTKGERRTEVFIADNAGSDTIREAVDGFQGVHLTVNSAVSCLHPSS